MNKFEGNLNGKDLKIGIVVARFNDFITSRLLDAAVNTLARQQVVEENIDITWVPGAFEIPILSQVMADTGKYDAIIALGCVIRGATSHYDYVCNEAAKGIANVTSRTGVPVIFGVITTENIEQAIERAGTKAGNKGADCAVAAIETANCIKLFASRQ